MQYIEISHKLFDDIKFKIAEFSDGLLLLGNKQLCGAYKRVMLFSDIENKKKHQIYVLCFFKKTNKQNFYDFSRTKIC